MFCGTAVTILSGAVAERMRFWGYLITAALISGLIYPFFGHWAWNGLSSGSLSGWLGALGFVDFAGSTVVHSIGGWTALAAVIVIGARSGRFPKDRPPQRISGSNLPVAMLGVCLLWLGWFGFNGGSTLGVNDQLAGIVTNTMLAGAAGLLTALALSCYLEGRADVVMTMNGALAGLVAITAGCHAVSTPAAAAIGSVGSIVMVGASYLLERLRIDDAVGAVPVHLGAGIWGTLAVAFLGEPERLGTNLGWMEQLGIQAGGIAVCAAWAFGLSFFVLKFWHRNGFLRISPDDEYLGLNVSEHGATTDLVDLFQTMEEHTRSGNLGARAPVEPFTEVGQIAHRYNQVMDRLEGSSRKLTTANEKLQESTEEANRLAEEAQAANKTKSEFLANVSHEIRTPMNAILGFSELLERQVVDEKHRQYLSSITLSGKALLGIIDEILDLSKIEAGKLRLEPEPVDVAFVFNEIVRFFSIQIQEKGLAFHCDVDPTLPSRVLLDSTRLHQILFNLVGNAVKFTESGYIRLSVSKKFTNDDHSRLELIFSVRDTGIGIKKEEQERIFEAFTQQDGQDTRTYGGTGLGLAITKRLADLMGGSISIESEVDKGTLITVTLRELSIPSVGSPEGSEEEEEEAFNFEPATVLVVEDNAYNRTLVRELITEVGLQVVEAENGRIGFDLAREHHPDLILMDIAMPVMDGREAVRKIREDPDIGKIPIIVLTASIRHGREEIISELQLDGYLNKPVQRSRLLKEIGRFLPRRGELVSAKTVDSAEDATQLERPQNARLSFGDPSRHAELLHRLESDLMEEYESCSKRIRITRVGQFADHLKQVGADFDAPSVIQFAEALFRGVEILDVKSIQRILKGYPKMVSALADDVLDD